MAFFLRSPSRILKCFKKSIEFGSASASTTAASIRNDLGWAANRPPAAAPQQQKPEDVEEFKATLDEETRQRLESAMAEYEIFKYADSRMPSQLQVRNWRRMLLMETKTERIQYLTYLYEIERMKETELLGKNQFDPELVERVEKRRAEIRADKENHIYYGIGGSCLFRRILDSDLGRNLHHRLAKAMVFGPHLIFDMSFMPVLKPVEVSLTLKNMLQMYSDNRNHRFPHHLIFTGCDRRHHSWEDVERYFVGELDKYLLSTTEKHYLDLFPKEQLCYLSPDARITLNEYDPEKVYIVAAMVDKSPRPNLTLGRAKEEGIETRRLPLERCVRLLGKRSLCLNHVVSILNDAHAYGSVTRAILNSLPKRKVAPPVAPDASRNKREYDKQRLSYLRSVVRSNPEA